MCERIPAFTTIVPILTAVKPATTPKSPLHVQPRSPARRQTTTRAKITAVLDTPASNTYLQQQAEIKLRDFLTRRAVNTVQYYMQELGDSVTHNWLNEFEDFKTTVQEHDFQDGDGFLDRMMRSAPEEASMTIGHPRGRFSRTFHFKIEPSQIARRIFDVRVHLATEWANDLKCVEKENLEIQRMNFEKMVSTSKTQLDSKRNLIFDCDPTSGDHTPLQYKNYQALKTLITQQAVTRLLPFLRDQGSNHEYMYLLHFLKCYGAIANGDEFVQDVMRQPVEMRTNPSFSVVPSSIAVQILDLRAAIAKEWIDVMKFVPQEYVLMKRGMLEKSLHSRDVINGDGTKTV